MWKVKIKKDCQKTRTVKGETYTAERYMYDPYGKVFLKEKGCFEYVYNLTFLNFNDKFNFYNNK